MRNSIMMESFAKQYLLLIIAFGECVSIKNLTDREFECQQGTYRFREFCYQSFSALARYDEAEAICATANGHLAKIIDKETHIFVQQLRIRDQLFNYYIGITDKKGEGNWTYISNNQPVTYFNWYPGEPNDYGHGEDCATLRMKDALKWNDNGCSQKNLYICQYEGQLCKNKTLIHGTSCVELSKSFKSFDEAIADCALKGGNLGNPMNIVENRFLQNLILEDRQWLNLTEKDIDNLYTSFNMYRIMLQAWIGTKLNRDTNEWTFSDGENIVYAQWETGNPLDSKNTSFGCAYLHKKWNDDKCNNRLGFICQYPVAYATTWTSSLQSSTAITYKDNYTREQEYQNVTVPSEWKHEELDSNKININMALYAAIIICSFIFGSIWTIIFLYFSANRRWIVKRCRRNRENGEELLKLQETFEIDAVNSQI